MLHNLLLLRLWNFVQHRFDTKTHNTIAVKMLLSLFAKSTGQQNINSNSKLIEIEQFVCLKVEKYEKKTYKCPLMSLTTIFSSFICKTKTNNDKLYSFSRSKEMPIFTGWLIKHRAVRTRNLLQMWRTTRKQPCTIKSMRRFTFQNCILSNIHAGYVLYTTR